MSVDSGAAGAPEQFTLPQQNVRGAIGVKNLQMQSFRSNPGFKPKQLSQLSTSTKQVGAIEQAKALVNEKKSKQQLNTTLSPTRCALELNQMPS